MSDLIKAHEGNGDVNESDPLKIHWRKYNMMGGFVATTIQCKAQCLNSNDYNFPERPAIAELIVRYPVMSIEVWLYFLFGFKRFSHLYFSQMQKSRLKSHDNEFDEYYPSTAVSSQPGIRKLFFR